MSSIFGGKKSSSQQTAQAISESQSHQESGNKNLGAINDAFGGVIGDTGKSQNAIGKLLGLDGDASDQNAAFDNYKNSTGYQFQMDQGTQAISGGAATKGLLNSGSTAKALEGYGQNLASTTFNNYLTQLQGYGNTGLQAGSLVSGAGQYSTGDSSASSQSSSQGTSKSNEKPGIGKFLGTVGAGIAASDMRLKKDALHLYDLPSGLGVYTYKYKDDPEGKNHIGVLAQEALDVVPEAVSTNDNGFLQVDYDKVNIRGA